MGFWWVDFRRKSRLAGRSGSGELHCCSNGGASYPGCTVAGLARNWSCVVRHSFGAYCCSLDNGDGNFVSSDRRLHLQNSTHVKQEIKGYCNTAPTMSLRYFGLGVNDGKASKDVMRIFTYFLQANCTGEFHRMIKVKSPRILSFPWRKTRCFPLLLRTYQGYKSWSVPHSRSC